MTTGIALQKPKFGLVFLLILGAILALVVMASPSPVAAAVIAESEDNDIFGAGVADPVDLGDLYTGTISSGTIDVNFTGSGLIDFAATIPFGDIDVVSFSVLAGTTFAVRTLPAVVSADNDDTVIQLFNSVGTTPLVANDDCDLVEYPLIDLESCLRYTTPATPATGTYLVMVIGFGETGDYKLSLIPEVLPAPSDTTPPVIVLTGDDPQTVVLGDAYVELGATASDLEDGVIPPASIVIDASAVVTTVVGSYPVTYDVMDAAGNPAATETRTVDVVDLSPKALKAGAAAALAAYEDESKHIKKAIKEINKSLEKGWVDGDDTRLDPKKGKKVFDHEKKAVKELLKVIKGEDDDEGDDDDDEVGTGVSDAAKAAAAAAIEDLLAADAALAQTAIDDAIAAAGPSPTGKVAKELEKAGKDMDKALAELAKADPKPDKAIKKFKNAWKHAQKAIKHAGEDDEEDEDDED